MDEKAQLEQQWAERESRLVAKEEELSRLKAQVEAFPAQLQQAIEATEKTVTEHLQWKYDYEVRLAQKEVEGERRLYQQTISALETKINQQVQHIKELTEKNNQAGAQVQDIAVKAIEGASRRFYAPNYIEKAVELTKG